MKCAAKNMNIAQNPSGEWVVRLDFQSEVDIEKWENFKNSVTLQEQLAKTTQYVVHFCYNLQLKLFDTMLQSPIRLFKGLDQPQR